MRRRAAALLIMAVGAFCLFTEVLWMSAATEEHFGLPPLAARALVFAMGMTGFVLLYAGARLFRGR